MMTLPSHIRFPRDVEFLEDLPLLVYRPRGVLNEASVNRAIKVLGELEFSLNRAFNRFSDTRHANDVDLNFRYVLHISLYRRLSYSGRPAIKSAILATDKTALHYAKLHAILTQGSPIKVRIFEDPKDAAKWLKVPVERLAGGASGTETAERASASGHGGRRVDKGHLTKPARVARHSRFLDDLS